VIVKGHINGEPVEVDIEPIAEPQDEPIVFENKQELNEYIENYIVEFLTEGNGNDNGTD